MAQGDGYRTVSLAEVFPPGLDTETDPTRLQDGFTPDGFGFDLERKDRLATGTIPTGESRVVRTIDITINNVTNTYFWIYNRLWLNDGNLLRFGMPLMDEIFLPHNQGVVPCNTLTNNDPSIDLILPFSGNLLLGKSNGSFIVPGADSLQGFFTRGSLIQELKVTNVNNAIELEGIAFISNGSGLFRVPGGDAPEVSRLIRNSVGPFTSRALTADYETRRVIADGATSAQGTVYDLDTDKIFEYDTAQGTGFRWTSRTLTFGNDPFDVKSVWLYVEHLDDLGGFVNYQVGVEDRGFAEGPDHEITIPFDQETFHKIECAVEPEPCNKWRMRIIEQSSNIAIRGIFLEVLGGSQDDLTV